MTKIRFKAHVFRYKDGRKLSELVDESTGEVHYVIPVAKDTRGKKVIVGGKYWVTLGSNKQFYYRRILRRYIPRKLIRGWYAQVDEILRELPDRKL